MKIWYEQAAQCWTEALPIGNGRIGAMIFGKANREVIPLNEDSLWSGYPRDLNPKGTRETLLKAMKLTQEKKYTQAQELIERELTSGWSQSYLPLGDVMLEFQHTGAVSDYVRELELDTAVAKVEYETDGIRYKRQTFASAPDNIIAIHLSADMPESISLSVGFTSQLKSKVSLVNDIIMLIGEAPSYVEPSYIKTNPHPVVYSEKNEERGILFAAAAKVVARNGTIIHNDSKIEVKGADEVLILISARTSFSGFNVQPFLYGREYKDRCLQELKHACNDSFDTLRTRHVSDYKSLFDRVYLDLGENSASALPTDKRLFRFLEDQSDLALYSLLFQYGRYLLISSSREGTQPANLQGIWNSELRPPWSSNFTININTQMNYWPVFSCALGELQQPLVKLIEELAVTGSKTAHEMYGAKGFVSHHNTDIWRLSSPVGNHTKGSACFAYWNMSAGWLCRHLFDQYEYTLDKDFLKDTAYPLMKSAAEFLLDVMDKDKDGYYVLCPSTSPENTFAYEGERCNISITATMSMSITKELFKNCIKSCGILGCDQEFSNELKGLLGRLLPYKTGSKGQLLEWYEEYDEIEPSHRHISHLYGLHPSNDITVEETPELAEACKVSLNLRGDDGTGWSLAWKINQWARLFDGDRALKLLARQLRVVKSTGYDYMSGGGTYINMLDAHPPFQIEGNFGAASGIAEMLLQSRDNKVFILPALPSAWGKGYVRGLRARNRIKANIRWNESLIETELLSDVDQVIMLAIRNKDMHRVELKSGIPYTSSISSTV